MGCDAPSVLVLDIVRSDPFNRMGSSIRRDSVRGRLRVLRESRKIVGHRYKYPGGQRVVCTLS